MCSAGARWQADVRCPYCGSEDDKVVDSRNADDGRAIRRRRHCLECDRRYTTFERVEEIPLLVQKRGGGEEPFDRAKIAEGIRRACKNRPVADAAIANLTEEVEEDVRARPGRTVPSALIGQLVLERLAALDEVAYLRFASVYKDFKELDDFERELGILLKRSPPKARNGGGP